MATRMVYCYVWYCGCFWCNASWMSSVCDVVLSENMLKWRMLDVVSDESQLFYYACATGDSNARHVLCWRYLFCSFYALVDLFCLLDGNMIFGACLVGLELINTVTYHIVSESAIIFFFQIQLWWKFVECMGFLVDGRFQESQSTWWWSCW